MLLVIHSILLFLHSSRYLFFAIHCREQGDLHREKGHITYVRDRPDRRPRWQPLVRTENASLGEFNLSSISVLVFPLPTNLTNRAAKEQKEAAWKDRRQGLLLETRRRLLIYNNDKCNVYANDVIGRHYCLSNPTILVLTAHVVEEIVLFLLSGYHLESDDQDRLRHCMAEIDPRRRLYARLYRTVAVACR